MCHLKHWLFALLVLLVYTTDLCKSARAERTSGFCDQHCYIQRIHRLITADCYNKTCKHFPKQLKSNVEAIDATFNRIREITADDLKPFTNLQYLYLGENMITKIHPDAFSDKTDLCTLDLSYNAFSSSAAIPDVIFHLPSLKHLYLSQNQNINMIEVIERAAPIKAPLQHLDISFNNFEEEDLQVLPIMGILPSLIKYNVTGMHLILNTSQFAGLCNLEFWVNVNVTSTFENPCDCWNLEKWLKERNVHFESLQNQCTIRESECVYEVPTEHMEIYQSCKMQHAEQVYQSKLNKSLLIGGSIFGIIFIALIIVLWRWRRTKIRRQRQKGNILHKMVPNDDH